jgi:hypothetical protein
MAFVVTGDDDRDGHINWGLTLYHVALGAVADIFQACPLARAFLI